MSYSNFDKDLDYHIEQHEKECKHENYTTDITEEFNESDGTGIEVHCWDCGERWTE